MNVRKTSQRNSQYFRKNLLGQNRNKLTTRSSLQLVVNLFSLFLKHYAYLISQMTTQSYLINSTLHPSLPQNIFSFINQTYEIQIRCHF